MRADVYIMEPLTAGTLECLALGVPTSYKRVMALTCGELLQGMSMSRWLLLGSSTNRPERADGSMFVHPSIRRRHVGAGGHQRGGAQAPRQGRRRLGALIESYTRTCMAWIGQSICRRPNPSVQITTATTPPLFNHKPKQECADMLVRSMAAARTFKRRVEAMVGWVGDTQHTHYKTATALPPPFGRVDGRTHPFASRASDTHNRSSPPGRWPTTSTSIRTRSASSIR